MEYQKIVEGSFIRRLNRFIAEVAVAGQIERVHVKNTGRCQELFIEGAACYLEEVPKSSRKTKYSLVAIYKGEILINIDSQVPNKVVEEAVASGLIEVIGPIKYLKREVTYGHSRFDLYYETDQAKGFIEVKGVTLEVAGLAMFPDAPTERGTKHVMTLVEAQKEGYTNYVFFLIQMDQVYNFRPHHERDPKLAAALIEAESAGVGLLVYNSVVTKRGIRLGEKASYIKDL